MKKIMMALAMCLMSAGTGATAQSTSGDYDTLVQRLEALESTLRNAIILTDQPCERLGMGWNPYRPVAGRFPLAAGQGRDDREEEREFVLGNEGGEYQHQLTKREMPNHQHTYKDHHFNRSRSGGDMGDEDDHQHQYEITTRKTLPTGGNDAHNNMPPYRVLNFCWRR